MLVCLPQWREQVEAGPTAGIGSRMKSNEQSLSSSRLAGRLAVLTLKNPTASVFSRPPEQVEGSQITNVMSLFLDRNLKSKFATILHLLFSIFRKIKNFLSFNRQWKRRIRVSMLRSILDELHSYTSVDDEMLPSFQKLNANIFSHLF